MNNTTSILTDTELLEWHKRNKETTISFYCHEALQYREITFSELARLLILLSKQEGEKHE